MVSRLIGPALLLLAFSFYIWSTDRVTLEGERTVYTVKCDQGEWQKAHCSGKLVAGDRFTFRASTKRQEVLYWKYGSSEPSGKYTDCYVKNRGNWSCNVQTTQRPAIIYEMQSDKPVPGVTGLAVPFHSVPKWKWWAIRYGMGTYRNAEV